MKKTVEYHNFAEVRFFRILIFYSKGKDKYSKVKKAEGS